MYGKGLALNSMEGREAKHLEQFPGMPRTQTSRIAGNKFSVMSLFPLYGCGRKAAT